MKTLFSTLMLTCIWFITGPHLQAQSDDTGYVVVEYMKVKPGMMEEYLACEEAWQQIHQYRVQEGLITGWELEEVLYPSGTNTEYDYLTITHYRDWKSMRAGTGWYEAAMNSLPADKREIAENAEAYRDIVKREVWTGGEQVFAPGAAQPRFRVENFMNIPAGGWEAWIDLETNFVKPVHEKNIAMGNRAGWLMSFMVMPRGNDFPYQASTIDFYNAWEDMDKDEGQAWEAVYPGMSETYVGERIESTRKLVRTEVRELVYSVE